MLWVPCKCSGERETEGPLAALGQRVSPGKMATEATRETKADLVSEVHLV